ncbi:MAG: hypothetical protein ACREMA_13515 [Longimicrobiales bacterium]
MVELNNRYALDGRDANSWGGITWILGRYDHPWPERPIYGTVRAMSSRSPARMFMVSEYLEAHGLRPVCAVSADQGGYGDNCGDMGMTAAIV